MARRTTGIVKRHGRSCTSRAEGNCNCQPSYEAWVYSRRDGKKIRRTFPTEAAAKGWRADATSALRKGTLKAPTRQTLREAADQWLERARRGEARTRSGVPYKPSALRGYDADLTNHVLPDLGALRLSEIRRRDVQDIVDRLVTDGSSGSKVRNAIMPLRVIFRHAIEDDELTVNPTAHLRLPKPAGSRERAASPEEAAKLLEALAAGERALWATAFYAGLRRGELRELRWSDLDDGCTVIHVQRGRDDREGVIETKNRKTRKVPVATALRLRLLEHKALTGRRGDDLVFGKTATEPFVPWTIRQHALDAWATAKLQPIGLHEARHTYVSLMHAAGCSLEEIGDYAGHSGVYMTDRYRHLLEGQREQAAERLDAFLTGAQTGARGVHAV
jgi:integrase